LCSVLRPRQRSIGYMGDGFHRSKDPTNSIKVLKEKAVEEKPQNTKKTQITQRGRASIDTVDLEVNLLLALTLVLRSSGC